MMNVKLVTINMVKQGRFKNHLVISIVVIWFGSEHTQIEELKTTLCQSLYHEFYVLIILTGLLYY